MFFFTLASLAIIFAIVGFVFAGLSLLALIALGCKSKCISIVVCQFKASFFL